MGGFPTISGKVPRGSLLQDGLFPDHCSLLANRLTGRSVFQPSHPHPKRQGEGRDKEEKGATDEVCSVPTYSYTSLSLESDMSEYNQVKLEASVGMCNLSSERGGSHTRGEERLLGPLEVRTPCYHPSLSAIFWPPHLFVLPHQSFSGWPSPLGADE